MVFLYVTCKDMAEAEKIADAIMAARAAGCVNMFPSRSMWRNGETDEIEKYEEAVLIVKTQDVQVQTVERIVHTVGSYKIPCVASFAVTRINQEYKEWLGKVTGR